MTPAELLALDARIARLRTRLRNGDPDMAADEIQAAIETAEAKRAELAQKPQSSKDADKIVALLPKNAERYRKLLAGGITKNREESTLARHMLRQLVGGEIVLVPVTGPDGSKYLEARFLLHRVALFGAVPGPSRFVGSGGRI